MNEIFKRASVRSFQDKPVEKEKIDMLLKAAMQAPSARNQQPWEFIVVENRQTLNKLGDLSEFAKPAKEAALAVVLLGNKDYIAIEQCWQQDMGACTQNILLEAVSQGLGGVWLGVAPREDRMEYVSKLLNLPGNIMVFAVVAIGYPKNEPNINIRYDEKRVYFEEYK